MPSKSALHHRTPTLTQSLPSPHPLVLYAFTEDNAIKQTRTWPQGSPTSPVFSLTCRAERAAQSATKRRAVGFISTT